MPRVWHDEQRQCQDGSKHEGKLELITWPGVDSDGEELGWGACVPEESDDLRGMFQTQYHGDEAKFYEYWPQGFRWTCCGCLGDNKLGCDHHGTGSTPCKCDFCVMGKPLPSKIYKPNSQRCRGLTLSRGPDPRSHHPEHAHLNEMMRGLLGLSKFDDTPEEEQRQRQQARSSGTSSGAGTSRATAATAANGSRSEGAGPSSTSTSSTSNDTSNGRGGRWGSGLMAGFFGAPPAQQQQQQQQHVEEGVQSTMEAPGGSTQQAGGTKRQRAAAHPRLCASCHQAPDAGAKLKKCAGCGQVRYCCKTCQAAHWPQHKAQCRAAGAAARDTK